MTSIPASRRARAMILAPLSWPSKPTFATTTLIVSSAMNASSQSAAGQHFSRSALPLFLLVSWPTLYLRCLAVGAVDLLHRVADLLHGGVGPDCFDGRVHGVLALLGRFLDSLEALLDLSVVAALFELPEAVYLVLGDLFVDFVRLDVGLFLGLVDVDVDDVLLLLLDLALIAG